MRIICPKCDAQYEVPDEVIPPEGRDVQCSNCGHTWMQLRSENAAQQVDPSVPESDVETGEDAPDIDAGTQPEPKRQELQPEVADILRQEAERESAARAAEAATLETQPDLGLTQAESESERRHREARDRMARVRDTDVEVDAEPEAETTAPEAPASTPPAQDPVVPSAAVTAAVNSRKELLPDIEEIKSTLRSSSDRELAGDDPRPEAPARKRERRGFRRGFYVAILLIALAVAVYVFAPQIAAALPEAEPYLSGYMAWVDELRVWLNAQMQ